MIRARSVLDTGRASDLSVPRRDHVRTLSAAPPPCAPYRMHHYFSTLVHFIISFTGLSEPARVFAVSTENPTTVVGVWEH